MSDDDESVALESEAPEPEGEAVSDQPSAQHPLWERAAGRVPKGSNANKARKVNNGRHRPISMMELELRTRHECDGASTVADDSEYEDDVAVDRPPRSNARAADIEDYEDEARRAPVQEPEPEHDEQQDEREDDGWKNGATAKALAGAIFGGNMRNGKAPSVGSDTDDSRSITSLQARQAQKRACPINGVNCVGCTIPQRVTVVDDFVFQNFYKMQHTALYKMAALVYKQKVEEPATAEGLRVPEWGWKQILTHYTMHRMDQSLQRSENVRALAMVRKTLELSLMKDDDDSGEPLLDKSNVDTLMKVIGLQSKELQLMHDSVDARATAETSGAPTSASQPKAGSGRKRAR